MKAEMTPAEWLAECEAAVVRCAVVAIDALDQSGSWNDWFAGLTALQSAVADLKEARRDVIEEAAA